MMMNKINAEELLEKYLNGQATAEEQNLIQNWFLAQSGSELPDATELLEDHFFIKNTLAQYTKPSPKYKLWPRIAAAAVILLVAGAGVFFYTSRPVVNRNSETVNQNDVAPGHNGATLTLANGKKIRLSDAKNGELVKQAGVTVTKKDNGEIVYEIQDNTPRHPELVSGPQSNTLTTAKGETFQVRLPDGTKAWLNAASTLTYPASFAKLKNRKVELSGEAYFEVAKDKAHPFIVQTDKQTVEVLGTHFNINSYADEANTKTTLLEGSVRVAYAPRHPELVLPGDVDDFNRPGSLPQSGRSESRTGKTTLQDRDDPDLRQHDGIVLTPNQQAVLANNRIKVTTVAASDAIAWKNGVFKFNNVPLESIMRQLARWYNIEVIYKGNVGTEAFNGVIDRKANLSRILKILEKGGVSFKIEGKELTVIP